MHQQSKAPSKMSFNQQLIASAVDSCIADAARIGAPGSDEALDQHGRRVDVGVHAEARAVELGLRAIERQRDRGRSMVAVVGINGVAWGLHA